MELCVNAMGCEDYHASGQRELNVNGQWRQSGQLPGPAGRLAVGKQKVKTR